jgi:hypothetical protein
MLKKCKGNVSEPTKYMQEVASIKQEKLQRSLQQCTAGSVKWGFV